MADRRAASLFVVAIARHDAFSCIASHPVSRVHIRNLFLTRSLPDFLAVILPELRDYLSDLLDRAAASSSYQAQVVKLQQLVAFLEDRFRLAQIKRFALSSEKSTGQGRLFNQAEQDAAAFPEDDKFDAMPAQPIAGSNVLLKPLHEAMRPILLVEPLVHDDETTVQVLKKDGRKSQAVAEG